MSVVRLPEARTIHAADLFCGAGGTSLGMGRACRRLGLKLDLTAINHWPIAIDTHSANHPAARHLCESLDGVDPRKVIPSGRLDFLVASPECIYHSRALAGKPINDQSRASAWHVIRWLESLNPKVFLVENVPEFADWGPARRMEKRGRVGLYPDPARKGETFRAWCAAAVSLGYTVEVRRLCAADYGDATTRERLFVMGRRSTKKARIEWPEATHARVTAAASLRQLKPWRAAREIIDWSIPGNSIYGRKKPLAPKTLARIAEGLRRFGGEQFTLAQGGGGVARHISQPVPTITTDGAVRVVDPIVVTLRNHTAPRTIDEPLTTISGSGNHHMLLEAFIACYYGTTNLRPVSQPLPTITTKDRFALVEPVVIDGQMLDIRVRMLHTRELARATSFNDDYFLAGNNEEQKKQIGNAVPGELSTALCLTALKPFAAARRQRRQFEGVA